jgi:hypothetical protein
MKKCLRELHHNGNIESFKLVLYAIEVLSPANIDCLVRFYYVLLVYNNLK